MLRFFSDTYIDIPKQKIINKSFLFDLYSGKNIKCDLHNIDVQRIFNNTFSVRTKGAKLFLSPEANSKAPLLHLFSHFYWGAKIFTWDDLWVGIAF